MNLLQKKIENIILFFANKSSNNVIDRLKLMKLIWLSDRIHLIKHGRLVLKGDVYKALPNGPIASNTLNLSNYSLQNSYNVENYNIHALKESDLNYFSKSDIEIMEYVWEKFKNFDSFQLRDFSHLFPEWLRFKDNLENEFSPNAYDIVIDDFFVIPEEIKDFNDIINEADIKLTKEEFYNYKSISTMLNSH